MKKKTWIVIISIAIFLILSGTLIFLFTNQDKETTLTIVEKKWIENNKNKIIDLGILNNVAILNHEGDGLFFDFLESLETVTGLEFNKMAYQYGEDTNSEYAFKVVDKVGKNDLLIYRDNYVILGRENKKYNSLNDIQNLKLGVLNENLDDVNHFVEGTDITFQTFKTVDKLLTEMQAEDEKRKVDAIVLPKLIYLSKMTEENQLYINYNITEMEDNYVITLGKTDRLNDIIKKYYQKWYDENYVDVFAKHFTNTYFTINKIDEQSKVKFRSKRYVYAFVNKAPFDIEMDSKLIGINSSIIKDFSDLTNVEITYKEYANKEKLLSDFNENKIDFFFDDYKTTDYKMDTFKTISPYDEKIAIVSSYRNDITLNSVKSLKKYEISVLASSKIEEYLKANDIKVKTYNTIEEMIKNKKEDTLLALDKLTYQYHQKNMLENNKIDFEFTLDSDYGYMVRDIKDNKIFLNFLNYYLGFVNEKTLVNQGYYATLRANTSNSMLKNLLFALGAFIVIIILLFLGRKVVPKKKKATTMKKEDKLKYVDMLTSLKNRNYLNDSIERWDESEVYPQTIIIVDLNNIAYINDNYGHQEGDNVIKEAANILITNQMPNSDIIRTNGNEFLIYLVEYDEKQIVAYIRKLAKEFKELSHGFGAAIGYSMITDAIKTIDDAVNEATLDMRNNKEELNN